MILIVTPNFVFYKEDVCSAGMNNILAKAKTVIHLAAIVGAPACDKNPKEAYRTNVEGTKNIVSFLSPEQRLLYPNTNSG